MRYKLDEYVLYLYPKAYEDKADLINSEKHIAKVIRENDPKTNKTKIVLLRRNLLVDTIDDNLIKLRLSSINHKINKRWGELFLKELHFKSDTIEPDKYKTYTKDHLLIVHFPIIEVPNSNTVISSVYRWAKNYRINDNISIEEFIDKNFNTETCSDNFPVIETFNDLINILEEEKLLALPKDEIWCSIADVALIEFRTEQAHQ